MISSVCSSSSVGDCCHKDVPDNIVAAACEDFFDCVLVSSQSFPLFMSLFHSSHALRYFSLLVDVSNVPTSELT